MPVRSQDRAGILIYLTGSRAQICTDMKKFKQVVGDGLAITVPLLVIIYVLFKAHKVIQEGIGPIAEKLGIHQLFGKLTMTILAAVVLLTVVLFMGLLMRFAVMRAVRREIEGVVLRFFPFLNEFKAMMADKLDRDGSEAWKSVALRTGEGIQFAFLVEETADYGTFLVLKGHQMADGEMIILETGNYSYQVVDATAMGKAVKRFGVGASALLGKFGKI
jgi:hypothetical protein